MRAFANDHLILLGCCSRLFRGKRIKIAMWGSVHIYRELFRLFKWETAPW